MASHLPPSRPTEAPCSAQEVVLPRRVHVMAEAMQPLRWRLDRQLVHPVVPVTPVHDMTEVLRRHLDRLSACYRGLTCRVDQLMSDVVANDAASDGEVRRAVGRFEDLVAEMLASWQEVQALDARGHDAQARELLAGVYRRALVETRDWLEALDEVSIDLAAVLRRHGRPPGGPVEIHLPLRLTVGPELAALSRWINRSGCLQAPPAGAPGLGFWGHVGAAALGWALAECLLGDDD
jgi:AcrR family transcriptional regulator